jgi:hypothetical protein
MNSSSAYPGIGACPFCSQPFKLAGALANHMEREHPKLQHRLSKRKRANTNDNYSNLEVEETDARQAPYSLNFEVELRSLFSEFPDFSPEYEALKRTDYVDITYDIDTDNVDAEASLSDANKPMADPTTFPAEREAGKAISASPFTKQRQQSYNFFSPFQNVLDFKLARFFYTAHVPKARIDEFFKAGFVKQETDAGGRPRFSFNSSHGLYQRLDTMIVDPAWKNGFVDFRLAKNTEFWYRDILELFKYLLRLKFFAPHMFWAPVRQFDRQQERVYTEMNTASWWWDTQV